MVKTELHEVCKLGKFSILTNTEYVTLIFMVAVELDESIDDMELGMLIYCGI